MRPSGGHSSLGLGQLDKAGSGRVWAMLENITEAPGQTGTLWTSVPHSSPSCLHLGWGFMHGTHLIKAGKGKLFTSALFSAFVNLLYILFYSYLPLPCFLLLFIYYIILFYR